MTASLENPSLRKLPLDSDKLVTVSAKDHTNLTNSSLEALKTSLQLDARKLDFFKEELKQTLSAASEACLKHIALAPCDLEWSDTHIEANAVFTEASIIKDELIPESEPDHETNFLAAEFSVEGVEIEQEDNEEVNSWRQFIQNQQETANELSAERKCLENALDASLLQHAERKIALRRISKALHCYRKHTLEPRIAAVVTIQYYWRAHKARVQFQEAKFKLIAKRKALLHQLSSQIQEQSVVFRVTYDPYTSKVIDQEETPNFTNDQRRLWLPEVTLAPAWNLQSRLTLSLEEWKKAIIEVKSSRVIPTAQVVQRREERNSKNDNGLHPLRGLVPQRRFSHLEQITKLEVDDEAMESFSGDIGKLLPNLEALNLNNSGLRDLTPLLNCTNLTSLCLKGNSLIEISSIGSRLTQLKDLCLSHNRVQFLGEWKMPFLRTLDLSWNQIQSLVGTIWQCSNLQRLDLSHNELSSFDDTPFLSNLTRLDISHNQITDFKELCSCSTLKWLDLSNNGIQGPFPNLLLPCLMTLYLNGNAITNLRSRFFLPSLKLLSLRGNQLEEIEQIAEIFNLTDLDLSFNKLNKIKDLKVLEKLRKLQSLRLIENEASFDAFEILELIPWIKSLDNETIFSKAQKKALRLKITKSPVLRLKIQRWIQEGNGFVSEADLSPLHLLEFLQKDLSPTPELLVLHSLISAVHMERTQPHWSTERSITDTLGILSGEEIPTVKYSEAAKIIQRKWRAHKTRKEFILRVQRTRGAVDVISQYWIKYKGMKQLKIELGKKQHIAACTIQSYFRSFHLRKQIKRTILVTKQSLVDLSSEDFNPSEEELEWIQSLEDPPIEGRSFLNDLEIYKVEDPIKSEAIGKEVVLVEDNLKQWGFKNEDTMNNYYKSRNKQRKQRTRKKRQEKMKDPQARLKEFYEKAKRQETKHNK